MADNTIAATLLGVPIDLGAKNLGVDIGPDAFRYQDIIKKLQSCGFDMTDAGNIACPERSTVSMGNNPKLKYANEVQRIASDTAAVVEKTIRNGDKAIVIGGDHSLTLGTVSGASAAVDGDIGLIYFDAHGDMNTDETTLTGNIHGMHVAFLLGFGDQNMVDTYNPGVKVRPENLVHIGGCDFDEAEHELVRKQNLHAFFTLDLMKDGLRPALKMIDELNQRVNNIWVSLDLDAIDSTYAPGAGMPNAKGLTYREASALAEHIGRTSNVVGVDVVEYNPLQDIDRKTAELGTELIATFLGKSYSWYSHYLDQNEL